MTDQKDVAQGTEDKALGVGTAKQPEIVRVQDCSLGGRLW